MSPEMMREKVARIVCYWDQSGTCHDEICTTSCSAVRPDEWCWNAADTILALTAPARGDGAYEFVKRVGRLSHTQDEGSTRDYDDPDADTEALDRLIGEARELMSLAAAPAAPAADGSSDVDYYPSHEALCDLISLQSEHWALNGGGPRWNERWQAALRCAEELVRVEP